MRDDLVERLLHICEHLFHTLLDLWTESQRLPACHLVKYVGDVFIILVEPQGFHDTLQYLGVELCIRYPALPHFLADPGVDVIRYNRRLFRLTLQNPLGKVIGSSIRISHHLFANVVVAKRGPSRVLKWHGSAALAARLVS